MPEISDERLDEILAAAGKAVHVPGFDRWIHLLGDRTVYTKDPSDGVRTHVVVRADDMHEPALDHIANCDPATITTLIAEVKAARAGKGVGETVVVPLTPTAEMLKAGMDDLGWWVEPYTAPRESGVPVDNDMSTADAASINAMQMAVIEGLYRAMLAAAPALPSLEPQGAQEAVAKPLDPLKWVKHVSLDGKDIWFEAKTTICEYIAHPNGRWGCRELSIRERGQGDSLDDAKEAARKHYLALLQGREAADDL